MTVTLPASPNHELSFNLGWMKWVILGHREGLVRNSVHIEGHTWEFHIEDVVMPLLITALRGEKQSMRGLPSHPETVKATPMDTDSKSPIRNNVF